MQSIRQMTIALLLTMVVAAVALAFTLYRVGEANEAVAQVNQLRYNSYLLADELRQSSDDLTRFPIRLFNARHDPAALNGRTVRY